MEIGKPFHLGTLVAAKPYSLHPDDANIFVVLVKLEKEREEWVTWIHNRNSGGCSNGIYRLGLAKALQDFDKRGFYRSHSDYIEELPSKA